MKRKELFLYALAVCIILAVPKISAIAASESTGTIANIKSSGRINYDNNTADPSDDVIFDASDFIYLAGKVEELKALAQ